MKRDIHEKERFQIATKYNNSMCIHRLKICKANLNNVEGESKNKNSQNIWTVHYISFGP